LISPFTDERYHAPRRRVDVTGVPSVLIATLILIVAFLNHPFSGPGAIGSQPFQSSLKLFDLIDVDFRQPRG
jgi:hypothetical protein